VFTIELTDRLDDDPTRVFPVGRDGLLTATGADSDVVAFAASVPDACTAGAVQRLPRPLSRPATVLLAGTGDGDEGGWRAAGAGVARAVPGDQPLQVVLSGDETPAAVRGLAEGLWLGAYRYRDGREEPRTGTVRLVRPHSASYASCLAQARASARAAWLARDLTNAPPSIKNPEWVAEEVVGAAAKRDGLTVTVRSGDELARFGGLRAVGGGSVSPPCLVEMSWRPAGATRHVVLIGKGITFDSGGISIKDRPGMKLMKNDMAGAAAVAAATLGAAESALAVRVTALLPLAENAVSGSAYRPGDVITHYDGTTSESTNSDAEGRLVLADALGYAVAELDADVIIDIATLTVTQTVALGHRIAALYSDSDELAGSLTEAGRAVGERMWRLPLVADYRENLRSDIADRHSSPVVGGGPAALFLHDFLGDRADRWAHLDIAGPAWTETSELELTRGATGWGARLLLRYLSGLAGLDGLSAFDGGEQAGA
jgi:leucyl aminopeptidase